MVFFRAYRVELFGQTRRIKGKEKKKQKKKNVSLPTLDTRTPVFRVSFLAVEYSFVAVQKVVNSFRFERGKN